MKNTDLFFKILFLLCVLAGFIYLNSYLNEFGIPFPLDLTILPTALIFISCISILIVGIGILYIFIVAIVNMDFMSIGYKRIINTNRHGVYNPRKYNYLTYSLISYILPFIFSLVVFYNYNLKIIHNQIYLFSGYLAWAFSYGAILTKYSKEKYTTTFKLTFHFLLTQSLSLISFSVLLAIILPRTSETTPMNIILYIIGFLIVNTMLFFPSFSKEKFNEINNQGIHLSADQLIEKTNIAPPYFMLAIFILLSLFPPFSSFVTELSLRKLNIGGGTDFTITDSYRRCLTWPNFVMKNMQSGTCTSNNGKLILQLGDRAYAIFYNNKKPTLVSLNLSKASISTELPQKSIYSKQLTKN